MEMGEWETEKRKAVARVIQAVEAKDKEAALRLSRMLDAKDGEAIQEALRVAVRFGISEAVAGLGAAGADVNERGTGEEGMTALHLAVLDGNDNLVLALLEAGASARKRSGKYETTPRDSALAWRFWRCAEALEKAERAEAAEEERDRLREGCQAGKQGQAARRRM